MKAGGSPEWNYMLLKWNLKMFILHWFLQCFMALYQFIGALKVSDVARTNSEFVRAEKLYFNHLLTWTKILVSFSYRNYGIRFFLMFCARDKNVIIYWRTMGEMTFALFSNFTSRAVFWKSRLEVVHRLSFLGATSMLSGRSQVQVSYGYNRQLECFYVPPVYNIITTTSTHLPWTSSIER